ncbi:T9SS type A sorting domain-containing protein [Hymenobacter daeguensis]
MKRNLLHSLLAFLLLLGLRAQASTPPPTGRPLTEALSPDGTLKTGLNGSFDARQFRMGTTPDGRPVFRPAGTTGAGDERWADGFGLPGNGVNGSVYALAVTSTGDVYAGGLFTQAGGVVANGVAKWNGTTWSSLGTGAGNGVDGAVFALAVANTGEVYVGGSFSQAGGAAANNVAKWNGTAWSSLGTGTANGVIGVVNELAVATTGELYVGGDFLRAGGLVANRVAKWSGTAWSTLGTGTNNGVDDTVYALAVASTGEVYVGGRFFNAGTVTVSGGGRANSVAKWNGTVWTPLTMGSDNGVNGPVSALVVANTGEVYVSGTFTRAGSIGAFCVAKWNGTVWSSLGTGASSVGALALAGNGDVYVGGAFTQAGGMPASKVAKWNGTGWSALGTGINNNFVFALAIDPNGKLYAGGQFTATGDGSKAMSNFGIYDPNAPLATTAANAAPAAQLYPNPAHGTATVRLPAGAPRLALTLTDALGRTVRRYPAPATAQAELDLRGLPAGTYVVRCGEYSQRLVVE